MNHDPLTTLPPEGQITSLCEDILEVILSFTGQPPTTSKDSFTSTSTTKAYLTFSSVNKSLYELTLRDPLWKAACEKVVTPPIWTKGDPSRFSRTYDKAAATRKDISSSLWKFVSSKSSSNRSDADPTNYKRQYVALVRDQCGVNCREFEQRFGPPTVSKVKGFFSNLSTLSFGGQKEPERGIFVFGPSGAGCSTFLRTLGVGRVRRVALPLPGPQWDCEYVEAPGNIRISHVYLSSSGIPSNLGKRFVLSPYLSEKSTKALIFILDSSEKYYWDEVRDMLHNVLDDPLTEGMILLVYANMQDKETTAASVAECVDKINLHRLRKRAWFIQGSCFDPSSPKFGFGIFEGLDWMYRHWQKEVYGKK